MSEKTSLFKDISLTRNTVAELAIPFLDLSNRFQHFSIAIDESVDLSGIAQLAVFIRACDSDFHVIEELIELIPMHDTTTSQEIFEKVEQLLDEYGFEFCKLACLSTCGAANMACKHNGVGAKIRAKITALYPNSSFVHFHCIIHQQNLCSQVLKLDDVLKLVTKTVKYIRGHALSHRQFSQLLEDIDNQFTNLPFNTEVRWFSCYKVLERFYCLREEVILFWK